MKARAGTRACGDAISMYEAIHTCSVATVRIIVCARWAAVTPENNRIARSAHASGRAQWVRVPSQGHGDCMTAPGQMRSCAWVHLATCAGGGPARAPSRRGATQNGLPGRCDQPPLRKPHSALVNTRSSPPAPETSHHLRTPASSGGWRDSPRQPKISSSNRAEAPNVVRFLMAHPVHHVVGSGLAPHGACGSLCPCACWLLAVFER